MTELPNPAVAKSMIQLNNYRKIIVDETERIVMLKKRGMFKCFGGIGKRYGAATQKNNFLFYFGRLSQRSYFSVLLYYYTIFYVDNQ